MSSWNIEKSAETYPPCFSGQAPQYDNPSSVSSSGHPKPEYTETPKSIQEKIEMWYLNPLKKMSGHEGFICLAICFPLYEKFLRKTEKIEDKEKFSARHRVFKVIGAQFNISHELAYEFWHHWRNGLLHKGMPKATDDHTYWMTARQGPTISISANHVSINPWKFRDVVVKLIENNRRIWTDEDFPLAKELKEI